MMHDPLGWSQGMGVDREMSGCGNPLCKSQNVLGLYQKDNMLKILPYGTLLERK